MRRRRLLAAVLALVAATAAAASEKPDEKKKGGDASYIRIGGVSASVNRGGGRRGVMTVEVGVDVPAAPLRDMAQLSIPRLKAAYAQALALYAAGLSPGEPPNADLLAQTLQRQTDLVLRARGARLLLGSVIVN